MDDQHPANPTFATAAQEDILAEVLARFARTPNPRLRELVFGLVRHLHAFVRENRVTWQEWEAAMDFLAKAASVTKNGRNEFIALSDSIGLSMQVLATSQPKPPGATIPTLIGPFFLADAPIFPSGADISGGAQGQPLLVHGRTLDTAGNPIPGTVLNVWHSDERGLYDVQDNFDPSRMWGRGRIQGDAEGRYSFWSVLPTPYPAPMDAALGDFIMNTTKCFWRPAHLHFALEAPGADSLMTHLFVRGSSHIEDDVAFGVRPSLIVDFVRHEPGTAPDGTTRELPFHTLEYDFVLTRNGA
ncbi:MAG TPA: dioxygenase [Acetobacteraceae bacterium]|nr:dioxygenase [Acetobacteraceae bacterium]